MLLTSCCYLPVVRKSNITKHRFSFSVVDVDSSDLQKLCSRKSVLPKRLMHFSSAKLYKLKLNEFNVCLMLY